MKLWNQVFIFSPRLAITVWSASLSNGRHLCTKPTPEWITSKGFLGKHCSIAILFLKRQMAQAKPANTKTFRWLVSISPEEKLTFIKSLKLEGQPAQPKASLRQHHANLEIEHPKKTWLVDSTLPHKQQWISPFQPLFFKRGSNLKFVMF